MEDIELQSVDQIINDIEEYGYIDAHLGYMDDYQIDSILHYLKRYKELEEENEQLRIDNTNSLCEECSELAKEAGITEEDTRRILKDYRDKVENSIPISVIQNKIKELGKEWANEELDGETYSFMKEILQELLEERNK